MKRYIKSVIEFIGFLFCKEKIPHYEYEFVPWDSPDDGFKYDVFPLSDFLETHIGWDWTTDMSRSEAEIGLMFVEMS